MIALATGCALALVAGCSSSTEDASSAESSSSASALPSEPSDSPRSFGNGSSDELPIPIDFEWPDGWQETSPEELGVTGVAHAATYPELDDGTGFSPTILVYGRVIDEETSLTEIAEQMLEELRDGMGAEVEVLESEPVDDEDEFSGLVQVLDVSLPQRDVLEMYISISVPDFENSDRVSLLEFTLSAAPEDFEEVAESFQEFVAKVEPKE
ncbi:hypothetical protein [Saccharomonospora glauca]|uniref:Lipoprotein LpqN n=1 Tax=Saccharomonospora glauca K62 TaxID=928724 RepID=I1CZ54_9PSEU|nr:hypothetical protein [Saccharomonospora glauca]EIE97978.1 hypothetical protein SacglDRAFT_01043 [Saccharomonospora glauca K62]